MAADWRAHKPWASHWTWVRLGTTHTYGAAITLEKAAIRAHNTTKRACGYNVLRGTPACDRRYHAMRHQRAGKTGGKRSGSARATQRAKQ